MRSISSIVLPSPSEKRRAQCASSSESPIASNACEGLGEPARHADPEDRETPFWSKARTTDSPRIPGKVMFKVFGSIAPGFPFSFASAINSRIPFSSLSRILLILSISWIRWTANSAALPSPTIPNTFSVPARIPFSCFPPLIRGSRTTPLRIYRAPIPFGPYNLCPDIVSKSTPRVFTSIGILPIACTQSV